MATSRATARRRAPLVLFLRCVPPEARFRDIPLKAIFWAVQAVSRTLNYALSDFGIAQAAKVLGFTSDYNTLMARHKKAYQCKIF